MTTGDPADETDGIIPLADEPHPGRTRRPSGPAVMFGGPLDGTGLAVGDPLPEVLRLPERRDPSGKGVLCALYQRTDRHDRAQRTVYRFCGQETTP